VRLRERLERRVARLASSPLRLFERDRDRERVRDLLRLRELVL
jgi:hypothetical protein